MISWRHKVALLSAILVHTGHAAAQDAEPASKVTEPSATEPAGSEAKDATPPAANGGKKELGLLDPAGFGLYLWLGGGIGAGDSAAPARQVYDPKAIVEVRLEMSYSYAYFGMGVGSVYFDDEAPISQETVSVITGNDTGEATASAEGTIFDVELGAAHSFLLPGDDWAFRPGLGLGWQTSPEVRRLLECTGCDSETVLDEYENGPFGRAQLGIHRRFPTVVGLQILYQQFLGEVPDPALNWTLMAGIVFGEDGRR